MFQCIVKGMAEILASPGMIAALVFVLVVQVLSLLMLFLNVQVFRSQAEKYRMLLDHLEAGDAWGRPGRVLLPLYVVAVLGATVVTTLIFIFQPHIL